MKYVALLRGINVGGKNKVAMAELKKCFEELKFKNVKTFIASGNVIFETSLTQNKIAKRIELVLPRKFKLDSELIKVLIVSHKELKDIVKNAPKGFGEAPDKYYSDAIFLMGIRSQDAIKDFDPHPEVDSVWEGKGVIYHQRLSAKRTKSRMGRIAAKPIYKNITIRSWNTVQKIAKLL